MRALAGFFGVLALWPCLAMAGEPDITVTKPWIRYLLPNIPAGGYFTLNNTGSSDAVLTGATSPDCAALMLHESQDSSGMAMMMMVQNVIVPAGGSVSFAPGGYHLMCMQPRMKIGERVAVTLSFQGGAALNLTMPVYGPAGAP